MANQDLVDMEAHEHNRALGIKTVGGEVLPTSEHPTTGGNENARRRDYAAGTQTSTGSG
jgi:hypothetical protein